MAHVLEKTITEKPFILTLIPARGGSKGVPRKNALKLGGKPLIAYSIETAKNIDLIDNVVVSTEDQQLADIAIEYGAEIPFMRPKKFAQDKSKIHEAVNYTLLKLQKIWRFPSHYIIVTLFPTHPFRNVEFIRFLVEKAIEGFNVCTVKRLSPGDTNFFRLGSDHTLQLIHEEDTLNQIADNYFYRQTGLFLATHYSARQHTTYLHVENDPITQIDIDNWSDFYLAEEVIRENLFDFGLDYGKCSA
jgi:N-acylneuraminate cytidylyltransferase